MTKKPTMYRQGDVLLVAVDDIPPGAAKLPRDARGVVLAEGEATGHFPGIAHRSASLYRSENDARYLRATAGVQLDHQEHKTRCHACPEMPVSLATRYNASSRWSRDQDHEIRRYSCEEHAGAGDIRLESPGKTYIPPGTYARVIGAAYVPGDLPRNVAD